MHSSYMLSVSIDILKEVGNIGAGNAMTALSKLTQHFVDMSVAQVHIKHISDLGTLLGEEERYMAAMAVQLCGDIDAMLIMALEPNTANNLVKTILAQEKSFDITNEMHSSVLCETCNILAGNYINALSMLTNLSMTLSVPQIVVDMAASILSYPATLYAADADDMVLIESQFVDQQETSIQGSYFLILNQETFDKVVGVLMQG